MLWITTSNPVYSRIKPWWIGFMSFGLLTPPVQKLEGNLMPGFCPYKNNLNLD